VPDGDVLRARDDLPPDQRALITVNGDERWVAAKAIESAGCTLLDLRDDWTPSIFAEEHAADGTPLHNRYLRVFIGLANDQLDGDGQPLPPCQLKSPEPERCRTHRSAFDPRQSCENQPRRDEAICFRAVGGRL